MTPWAITEARYGSVGPSGSPRKVISFAVCQFRDSITYPLSAGYRQCQLRRRPLPGTLGLARVRIGDGLLMQLQTSQNRNGLLIFYWGLFTDVSALHQQQQQLLLLLGLSCPLKGEHGG